MLYGDTGLQVHFSVQRQKKKNTAPFTFQSHNCQPEAVSNKILVYSKKVKFLLCNYM